MSKDLLADLDWRGMVHSLTPGTPEQLVKEATTAYVGIDPTADSLHIGHLVSVMLLRHLQSAGHKPIALVGGATGMIGDPSMKSAERNLLDEETLRHNVECIKSQLSRFLDFEGGARLVNNLDWMRDYTFINFIRDVGKNITVNYMMAKDSVKKRLNGESREGMSFTEFSYQLLQGYDFKYLYDHYGCKLQLGGSDQWGNITTGIDLIRRTTGAEAYGLVCPLITKADGGKFGKTEKGNVWLDAARTTPYAFYQFWLNVTDDDAARYIRIFTLLPREEIEGLQSEHAQDPGRRTLQRRLAQELTTLVHGSEQLRQVEEASQILFGAGTTETLRNMDEATFLSVFEGVPTYQIDTIAGIKIIDLLTNATDIYPSKSELRRNLSGLQINRQKVTDPEATLSDADLLDGKYLLVQKGKKSYHLIKITAHG